MNFINKNSRLSLFLFFFLAAMVSSGQHSYLLKKDSSTLGINLQVENEIENSKFCNVLIGDKLVKYTPYEVEEYGFQNGDVYFSKDILLNGEKKRVFLKRLYEGKMSLYCYREKGLKTFFIEKDSSSLMELPKKDKVNKDFHNHLLTLTADCANVKDVIPLVSYTNHSLIELVKRYNRCDKSPFLHFRYGLTMGFGFTTLKKTSALENYSMNYFDLKSVGNFKGGVFAEFPIYSSKYKFYTELYYSKYSYSDNQIVEDKEKDLFIHFSSIKMPIMIRYEMSGTKIRPFINAGTLLAKNFDIEDRIFDVTKKDNVYILDLISHPSFISNYQYGFCAGAGLEYPLTERNSLFFELRLNKLLNISYTNYLNATELNLTTSFNF